jgi:hypothetical protein
MLDNAVFIPDLPEKATKSPKAETSKLRERREEGIQLSETLRFGAFAAET